MNRLNLKIFYIYFNSIALYSADNKDYLWIQCIFSSSLMSQSPDDTVTQSLVLTLKGIESGASLTNGYRTSDTRISIGTLLTLRPSSAYLIFNILLLKCSLV